MPALSCVQVLKCSCVCMFVACEGAFVPMCKHAGVCGQYVHKLKPQTAQQCQGKAFPGLGKLSTIHKPAYLPKRRLWWFSSPSSPTATIIFPHPLLLQPVISHTAMSMCPLLLHLHLLQTAQLGMCHSLERWTSITHICRGCPLSHSSQGHHPTPSLRGPVLCL